MKAAILALVTAGALLATTSTASANPPGYRSNWGGPRYYGGYGGPNWGFNRGFYGGYYAGYPRYTTPGLYFGTGNFGYSYGTYPYGNYGYNPYYGSRYYYGGRWNNRW